MNYHPEGALTPKHRNSSETNSHLSHRESIRVVQLHSTFPRLCSAENCFIIWHLLLDFWAVETIYTMSFLLSQYHVSIKIIATDTTEAQSMLRNSRKGDLWYKLCVKIVQHTNEIKSLKGRRGEQHNPSPQTRAFRCINKRLGPVTQRYLNTKPFCGIRRWLLSNKSSSISTWSTLNLLLCFLTFAF